MKLLAPPWQPITAPISSGSLCRSPGHLLRVVEQFDVAKSPRYRPTGKSTFCNVFVTDVTTALGAGIPHWWMTKEMTANQMVDWLKIQGLEHGWKLAEEHEARAAAAAGRPAVATYRSLGTGPGHRASGPSSFFSLCTIERGTPWNFSPTS
jgi:hypothetical protein